MIRRSVLSALAAATAALVLATAATADEAPCELVPKTRCYGLEAVSASLSTTQAGDHPDVTLGFEMRQDPESAPNVFGLRDGYATPRDLRFELPPGLIGNPNALGDPQLCTAGEFLTWNKGGGCPNGSQVGTTFVAVYGMTQTFTEPIYMMQPPGGDVVARLGFVAGVFPTFVDIRLRSEGDYGVDSEISDATAADRLLVAETTIWGVPADPAHDTERCTVAEAFKGCVSSQEHPPGGRLLPFWTNPTRCGVPLAFRVVTASWAEPERFAEKEGAIGPIEGCDALPFGPGLTFEPTSHRAGAPTGADVTISLPASASVDVLEPSQMRDIRVKLPEGLAVNTGSADGLATCSAEQVRFGERVVAECPDAAKLAATEFDIPVLSRRMKGAIYLREPEPGNPFRIWVVADDLGAHVKLEGRLEVNKGTGQIESVVLDAPQAPLREVKLLFKSGLRAPLVNPPACGTYRTEYEFTPWSGGPPVSASTPMQIDEGCEAGGFEPKLSAGSADPVAGRHTPFLFTLTREDGEQNPAGLDISLPQGFAATFAGIPRCEGADAESGQCPADSRIGRVVAAVGAGSNPLWVPQPGKRPTAIYLSGPYKGAPTSIVAVVPRQAGPFDFGDEVVRSAVFVNPVTARATAKADPLPQMIEGIPIRYRTLNVELDRPGFTLNPTSCAPKQTEARVTSDQGAVANPSAPFAAVNCARLGFKPRLSLKLKGGTGRGAHPAFIARVRPRPGDANLESTVVRLPHSAFLDQAHIRTICTRVQFAAGAGHGAECPAGSIYGEVTAHTPLLDEPLTGPVFLRSSNHNLPDMVFALHGPPSLPLEIEAVGRIDSKGGGIRSSFEAIPDAPLDKVVLEMQGGKKGLIVNSTDLCRGAHRAKVDLAAHNGRSETLHPKVGATKCKRHGKKHAERVHAHGRGGKGKR